MRERLRQAEADRNEAILRTRWLEEQRQESEGHQWTTPHVSRRSIDEVSVVVKKKVHMAPLWGSKWSSCVGNTLGILHLLFPFEVNYCCIHKSI